MWPFGRKAAAPAVAASSAAATAEAEACPTIACATCRNPMPIAPFDQACPRCRTVLKAARTCPGGCGGCEMGKKSS